MTWRWKRWRASHYVWLAYCAWYADPTPANQAAWERARENHERLWMSR